MGAVDPGPAVVAAKVKLVLRRHHYDGFGIDGGEYVPQSADAFLVGAFIE